MIFRPKLKLKLNVDEVMFFERNNEMFLNRKDAAEKLSLQINPDDFRLSLVLSLSLEGLIIAKELAHQLKTEYDLLISEILVDPGKHHQEFGTIVEDHIPFVMNGINLSNPLILEIIHEAKRKNVNKIKDLRNGKELNSLKGKKILLVDDWLVLGMRLIGSLHFLQSKGVKDIVFCSPVCDHNLISYLSDFKFYFLETSFEGNSIKDFFMDYNPLKKSDIQTIFHI